MHSGRIEALVVATLTMITSTLYVYKLAQWICSDGMKPYVAETDSIATREQIKRVFNAVISISIAGNVASFLTSLPIFMVVSKDMEVNRRQKYALLPYLCCHVFLCVTALNKLVFTVALKEDALAMKVITVRIFDVLTLMLSVILIGLYYYDLTFYTGVESSYNSYTNKYQKFENEFEASEGKKLQQKSKDSELNDHFII